MKRTAWRTCSKTPALFPPLARHLRYPKTSLTECGQDLPNVAPSQVCNLVQARMRILSVLTLGPLAPRRTCTVPSWYCRVLTAIRSGHIFAITFRATREHALDKYPRCSYTF